MPDVTIDWNAGRTQEQKDKIAKVVTDALVEIGKAPRENVKITFKDNPDSLVKTRFEEVPAL